MRPPGGILAPGESVVATGNSVFLIFSSLAAQSPTPLPHPPFFHSLHPLSFPAFGSFLPHF